MAFKHQAIYVQIEGTVNAANSETCDLRIRIGNANWIYE